MYMGAYDLINNKEGIGIPAAQVTATSTDTKHDKRPITAQGSIQEQGKGLYCRQASSTVGLAGSTINYDENEYFVSTAPIDGQNPKSFLRLYNHAYYITGFIRHREDIWVKGVRLTVWVENFTASICRNKCTRL